MRQDGPKRRRCAIYTRKSTEEGLDQTFNSLDAQREACAAYILSQTHEGWEPIPELYDDGGYSGGSMDRPGLQQLLADADAGNVDIIVVYKVDRLTRSLADFARIVDILDKKGASFVSVTQAFNTTTSMGRLTLNVLLSFAQFEREVTGERIRDKIAASKARGMWMGGVVPLGYEVDDRKLVIVPEEAERVRHIFARYLELGSVYALQAELAVKGIRTKARTLKDGRLYGDRNFSRGALYQMLANRIYLGEITHRGKAYPGEHEGIIDAATFEWVANLLASNRVRHEHALDAKHPSLLAGILWDCDGRRMSPNHANKNGARYRYYISCKDKERLSLPVHRVPAGDIENLVIHQLRQHTDANWETPNPNRELIIQYVEQITVHPDRIVIRFSGIEESVTVNASLGCRLINTEPQSHRGELDHGEEVFGQFVVAGGNPAEVLQLGEEALDQVPLAVEPSAEVRFCSAVGLWRDVGERPFLAERRPDAIRVVGLVRQHDCPSANMIEQTVGGLAIMALPGGQAQPDRAALPVDDRVDFGREATSGATETMISIPLFAVAAC